MDNKNKSFRTGEKNEKGIKCFHCYRRFKTEKAWKKHEDDHDDFPCSMCTCKFKTATYLKRHEKSHPKKKFNCADCSYRADTANHLKRHTDAVHEKKKDYGCDLCPKSFSQNENLKRHQKAVHKFKQLTCSVLDRSKMIEVEEQKLEIKINKRIQQSFDSLQNCLKDGYFLSEDHRGLPYKKN